MHIGPPKQLELVAEVIDVFDPPLRARKLSNKAAFQCLWYANTGVAWKYVPVTGCTFSAAYKRFQSWVKNNVIQNVWVYLLNLYAHCRLDENPGWCFVT
jgi:hypothetical protein